MHDYINYVVAAVVWKAESSVEHHYMNHSTETDGHYVSLMFIIYILFIHLLLIQSNDLQQLPVVGDAVGHLRLLCGRVVELAAPPPP